jgi:hypothetical protein
MGMSLTGIFGFGALVAFGLGAFGLGDVVCFFISLIIGLANCLILASFPVKWNQIPYP